jgi:hypothetical protein
LYGTKNIANEAIWAIDPTGLATVFFDYVDGDYDFGGLAYNPLDGLFYGTNDDSTPARGLYSIDAFGGGAITLVAAYPAGETDIDGLAVGDNVAYLITDQSGDFYKYDLTQGPGGTYTTITNPWTSSEVFAAGAWIPEPGTLLLLGGGALLALRRRR